MPDRQAGGLVVVEPPLDVATHTAEELHSFPLDELRRPRPAFPLGA
jgi:hypothetical protein